MNATSDHVDDHLEQRVEDPPEVAEEGVRALLPEVGLGQVADQPAARRDVADRLAQSGRWVRGVPRCSGNGQATSAVTFIGPEGTTACPAMVGSARGPAASVHARCGTLFGHAQGDRARQARPARPPSRRMLTHSYYEEDPRVRREAEALAAAGRPVDVFALRRPADPGRRRPSTASRVHRLGVQRHQGAGLGVYLAEYLAFFAPRRVRADPRPPPGAATAWSRSTRCPTSSSSRRCRSGWPAFP